MQSDKTKLFIENARVKHGDCYDYSLVEYVRSSVKVKIVCPTHGQFEQSPNKHANQGQGCPVCGDAAKNRDRNALAALEFVTKAKLAHGDDYSYAKVVYKNSKTRVIITCPSHGDFEQVAGHHLSGHGCKACADDSTATNQSTVPAREFVSKARLVHGDMYCYSLTRYVNARMKVLITCPIHGNFEQTPNNHLSGQGCSARHQDRDQPTRVYIMQSTCGKMVKIGLSVNPERRIKEHKRNGQPFESELVKTFELPDFPSAYIVEQAAHDTLNHLNVGLSGFDGASEWFYATIAEAKLAIVASINKKHLLLNWSQSC